METSMMAVETTTEVETTAVETTTEVETMAVETTAMETTAVETTAMEVKVEITSSATALNADFTWIPNAPDVEDTSTAAPNSSLGQPSSILS